LTASLTPLIAARYGWTASFMVAASLCVVGAIGWFLVNPDSNKVAAATAEPLV
jgi:MFS transporter, ACS family, glucarate transporter